MNKSKIIIIGSVSLLLLFCGYLFYSAYANNKGKNKTEQVSLISDKTKEYSYDDVLRERENSNTGVLPGTGAPNQGTNILSETNQDNIGYYGGEEQENIKRIQEQIRANNNNIALAEEHPYSSRPAPRHKPSKDIIENNDVPEAPASVTPNVEQKRENKNTRFFTAGNNKQVGGNSIRACVHGDQTVTNGSTLKLRLLEKTEVDGIEIPKNTFIYGTCKIENERVEVLVSSVRVKNNLFKFERNVYDRDAIKGIYVPGNIKSEARTEAADQGVNQLNPMVDGIVGTGVNAVVTAGKAVLSRNIKQTKVTIKTNYEIYLQ